MADVEDRRSAIRVERLTAIPVGAKGYVKIETNMGVTGWGEINNMNTKVACALAESLGEVVIGENPTRIEHLWQRMFRAYRNLRGGGFMMQPGEFECCGALEAGIRRSRGTSVP